jgi:catechol 2,3-dioxygenase-like lactoylglutathione lyase family enzyme
MRILTNICSNDLQKSKDFYVELLDFKVKYDSDWYVQLCSPDDSEIEYGIIQRNHDLVPKEYQNAPTGMYVTFVVDDVDMVYESGMDPVS